MSILKFSDGMVFDTSGSYRVETRSDGVYVVGRGSLIPVESEEVAKTLIDSLSKSITSEKTKSVMLL